MAGDEPSSTYSVGFGKPPKPTRFRKGASGNPKGRPRGRRNFATVLKLALQEKVVVDENGVRKTVTKLEAIVEQLVSKAMSGDLAAMRHLSALALSAENETAADPNKSTIAEADQNVIKRVLEKMRTSQRRDDDGNDK